MFIIDNHFVIRHEIIIGEQIKKECACYFCHVFFIYICGALSLHFYYSFHNSFHIHIWIEFTLPISLCAHFPLLPPISWPFFHHLFHLAVAFPSKYTCQLREWMSLCNANSDGIIHIFFSWGHNHLPFSLPSLTCVYAYLNRLNAYFPLLWRVFTNQLLNAFVQPIVLMFRLSMESADMNNNNNKPATAYYKYPSQVCVCVSTGMGQRENYVNKMPSNNNNQIHNTQKCFMLMALKRNVWLFSPHWLCIESNENIMRWIVLFNRISLFVYGLLNCHQ